MEGLPKITTVDTILNLFGFGTQDFQDSRTEQETSGRDLSPGEDKAWPGAQIWYTNWDGVGNSKKNPNGGKTWSGRESRSGHISTTKM